MSNITKNCIIEHLKGEAGLGSGEASLLLQSFFEEIENQLKEGNNVKFYGFGSFSKSESGKRKIKNINTGEIQEVLIPSKIKFKRNKKKSLKNIFLCE